MKKTITPEVIDDMQITAAESVKEKISSTGTRQRKSIFFQLSVVFMLVAFGILTFLVVTLPLFSVDLSITHRLQSITNPVFAGLMTYMSWVGFSPQVFFFILIVIIFLLVFRYYWEGTVGFLVAVTVPLLNLLVKELAHRARPSVDLIHIVNQIKGYSFPSGHVMFYTAFFGFICFLSYTLLKPSWGRTLLLVFFGSHVVLIGLSRIYLGDHWASDVIGAYLLGGLCLVGSIILYRRVSFPK